MNDWLPILKMSMPFLVLFGLSEGLYHFGKISAEVTRKVVHIGTGLLTLFFPDIFIDLWQVTTICSAFLLVLLLSMKYGFFPSINAVQRKTWGSVLFPVIVIFVFAFYLFMQQKEKPFYPYLFFCLPILIMAIADPVAAAVGNHYKRHSSIAGKTAAGSAAFFITAFLLSDIIISVASYHNNAWTHISALLIAFATTLAERLSNKGWDNFTVPLTAAGLLYLMA